MWHLKVVFIVGIIGLVCTYEKQALETYIFFISYRNNTSKQKVCPHEVN
jgi:hypothetical protein